MSHDFEYPKIEARFWRKTGNPIEELEFRDWKIADEFEWLKDSRKPNSDGRAKVIINWEKNEAFYRGGHFINHASVYNAKLYCQLRYHYTSGPNKNEDMVLNRDVEDGKGEDVEKEYRKFGGSVTHIEVWRGVDF